MTTLESPSALATSRRRRIVAPAVTLGALTAVTVALHFRDPHEQGSWGICPSAALGVYCPGCGGLRAVNDLTKGDLLGAASSNLLFIVLAPFLAAGLAVWAVDSWRGVRRQPPSWLRIRSVQYAALAVVVLFVVARNLPFGAWLAP